MTYRTSFREVLAMVREWVATQDQSFDAWDTRWALSDRIEGAYNRNRNLDSAYCAQILRALNMLTSEEVLVKRAAVRSRDPQFWTVEAYARHQEDVERAAADSKVQQDRFQVAYDRLATLGFQGRVSGLAVTFGMDDMERLADRLS